MALTYTYNITGDRYAYDNREGAIGDTTVRSSNRPPSVLQSVVINIRPRNTVNSDISKNDIENDDINNDESIDNDNSANNIDTTINDRINSSDTIEMDCKLLILQYSNLLDNCIVSIEDIYTTDINGMEVVGRVTELTPIATDNYNEDNDDENNEDDSNNGNSDHIDNSISTNNNEKYNETDVYRGIINFETEIYLALENNLIPWRLKNRKSVPVKKVNKHVVSLITSDDEYFPVLRPLLRPCLKLTSLVQYGKGIYGGNKNNLENNGNTNDTNDGSNEKKETEDEEKAMRITVNMHSSTFDKILLYLEHEARNEV